MEGLLLHAAKYHVGCGGSPNCVPRLNDVNELLEHVPGGDAKGEHGSLYVAFGVKRFLFMR